MPYQIGRIQRVLTPWQTADKIPVKTNTSWPVAIDRCLGQRHRALPALQPAIYPTATGGSPWNQPSLYLVARPILLPRLNFSAEPIPVTDLSQTDLSQDVLRQQVRPEEIQTEKIQAGQVPTLCQHWAPAPAADPVATFARTAIALPQFTAAPRFPAVLQMPLARTSPALAAACLSPAPEPVVDFVRPASTLTPVATMPALRLAAPLPLISGRNTLPAAGYSQAPAPEPVAEFIRLGSDLTPIALAHALRFPAKLEIPAQLPAIPAAIPAAGPCVAPAADPVASFLRPAAALILATSAAAIRLPHPSIAAELEPLPIAEGPMEPPAICLRTMPVPTADPVCRLVYPTLQSFLSPALPYAAPAFALHLEIPYVPRTATLLAACAAEPVMIHVRPSAVDLPLMPSAAAALMLPQFLTVATELLTLAAPVPALSAEPAETLTVAAASAIPVPAAATCRVPESPALVAANHEPSPALGTWAASLQPAPLESLLIASTAGIQAAKATVRMPSFSLAAGEDRMTPGFDALRLAPTASRPLAAVPKAITLRPIAMLSVSAPEQKHERFLPALPHPGIIPVEFHTQRSRAVPFERPEWKSAPLAVAPPRFVLRPIFGKIDEVAPLQKATRQEPEFIKAFPMPAKRPAAMLLTVGKIAAGLLLATSAWYGYSSVHSEHRTTTGAEIAAAETTQPSRSFTGRSASLDTARKAPAAGPGPVEWLRQGLAQRAALQVEENFHRGMQGWSASSTSYPAGWSRHPEGYITAGALALFRPSLNFKDYQFEFFGQIENKGMSWSVRSQDTSNYHAMKVAVVEEGLRPFVALVHWDVINGKAGRPSRIPLNIMVHNNRPMQVAVNVAGNRLVTSIDGEEVDSFTNNSLASGGVGFFSDTNERARVYWMKVSKNDDWLGHVCAFLSGDGTRANAELRGPGFPGRTPAPWAPRDETSTLAAAWVGLPYLRAAQRAQANHLRRIDPCNT